MVQNSLNSPPSDKHCCQGQTDVFLILWCTKGRSIIGGSWPKSQNSKSTLPTTNQLDEGRLDGDACPHFPTHHGHFVDEILYHVAASGVDALHLDLCIHLWWAGSGEWRVWPSTLNAATSVGAATRTLSCSRSLKQLIEYELPVPAVPEMIILSGGFMASICWCTIVYAWSCFPWSCSGGECGLSSRLSLLSNEKWHFCKIGVHSSCLWPVYFCLTGSSLLEVSTAPTDQHLLNCSDRLWGLSRDTETCQ